MSFVFFGALITTAQLFTSPVHSIYTMLICITGTECCSTAENVIVWSGGHWIKCIQRSLSLCKGSGVKVCSIGKWVTVLRRAPRRINYRHHMGSLSAHRVSNLSMTPRSLAPTASGCQRALGGGRFAAKIPKPLTRVIVRRCTHTHTHTTCPISGRRRVVHFVHWTGPPAWNFHCFYTLFETWLNFVSL